MNHRLTFLPLAILLSTSVFATTACSEKAATTQPTMEQSSMSELIKNDTKLGTGAEAIA